MDSDRPVGLRKYMAVLIFWIAVCLSVVSLVALPPMNVASWVLVAVSALFNVWALYQSDHGGFVNTRHAPRSKEPPRHFTPLQVVVVILLLMAQVALSLYLVVDRSHMLGS